MSWVMRSGRKIYFCYKCDRTVSISLSSSPQLICPLCHEGFLEEYQNPNPNPPFGLDQCRNPNPPSGLDQYQNPSPPSGLDRSLYFSPRAGGFHRGPLPSDPSLFRPSSADSRIEDLNRNFFVRNYHHHLAARGAAFRSPANFGDHRLGPSDLQQLIQLLSGNDPTCYGPPPASKTAVESLPGIKVSEQLLSSDSGQCAVCKDAFELGADVKQMPCKHIYHPDCILPWLELHNSCPVCRFELPTDDPDYERCRRMRGGPPNRVPRDSGEMHAFEPRFGVLWPWRFRGSRQPADAESYLNSGNGDRNQDLDQETRHEHLD